MHIEEQPLKFNANVGFSANKTYRVDFPVPIGSASTNRGVAKGDKKAGQEDPDVGQYKGLSDSSVDVHQDLVKKDMNLISRSVASSNVSKALGLNAVVQEAYANAPDGSGYVGVSALASGSQMMVNVVDENNQPKNIITRDFDFSRPEIQKGLYDLEAVDYITGQIDRHCGNIFINNETGQVEGIDNDLCFGEKPLSQATSDSAVGVKAVGAPPYFYHEGTAAAIEQMTPESLSDMLRGVRAPDGSCGLSEPEIQAACERLETMQAAIQLARSEGRVVSQFNRQTFEASLQHQQQKAGEPNFGKYSGTGNYVGRSQQELELAKKMSERPGGMDIVEPPGGPRELSVYEQELKAKNADIKQAEVMAILQPSPELQVALNEQYSIKKEIESLDVGISAALEDKRSLHANNAIAAQAAQKRDENIEKLAKCQASRDDKEDSPVITPEQASMLNAMVKDINAQPGERLDAHQRAALDRALRGLRGSSVSKSRASEVTNEKAFVRSAAPDLQQKKREALGRLSLANAKVNALVQQDSRVAQAVEAKQNFVVQQKMFMHDQLAQEEAKKQQQPVRVRAVPPRPPGSNSNAATQLGGGNTVADGMKAKRAPGVFPAQKPLANTNASGPPVRRAAPQRTVLDGMKKPTPQGVPPPPAANDNSVEKGMGSSWKKPTLGAKDDKGVKMTSRTSPPVSPRK